MSPTVGLLHKGRQGEGKRPEAGRGREERPK
jgi:hypothetical protein